MRRKRTPGKRRRRPAASRRASSRPQRSTSPGAEISALAAKGEQPARRIIKEAGFALGQAIAGLTNILDPDIVILSGSVVKAGAEWRAELQRGFDSQIPAIQRDLPIVNAGLVGAAPLIGAAENLIDSL